TVTVLDEAAGPLVPLTSERPDDERGRGLMLVGGLAYRWGTVHHAGGKGVWFHLPRPGAEKAVTSGSMPWPAVDPLAQLGPLADSGSLAGQLEEMLRRLAHATAATSAAILIDHGDDHGPRTTAAYGSGIPP